MAPIATNLRTDSGVLHLLDRERGLHQGARRRPLHVTKQFWRSSRPTGADGNKLQLQVYENPEEARRWFICQLELGTGLRAALAVEGKNCRVRFGRLTSTDFNVNARLAT